MNGIGMPEIVAGILLVALNAYALTGGADYGGGVWDLFASGPRRKEQREHIASSLAPIWEANHVWLIVVVVMLFTGFPEAFSELAVVLHVPLTILLVGIIARGSAFVFRSYGPAKSAYRKRWGLTFAIASMITPIVLGMIIGALARGGVGNAWRWVGRAPFSDVFLAPWLSPFPFVTGLLALALFAFLAAVYLAYNATDPSLREDFRRRAIGASVAVFVLAAIALGIGWSEAPRITSGVIGSAWAVPLQGFTAVAAITAIVALVRRHFGIARIAAAAQTTFILWGWAAAQYPYVIPHELTIRGAAAPRVTLTLLLIGLAAGGVILVPALRYLYGIFAKKAHAA